LSRIFHIHFRFTNRYFGDNRITASRGADPMQLPIAVVALSALAQEHRLAVFRLLVQAGAAGLPAGGIAREVGVLPNTLPRTSPFSAMPGWSDRAATGAR
jgi:hypothetical protein